MPPQLTHGHQNWMDSKQPLQHCIHIYGLKPLTSDNFSGCKALKYSKPEGNKMTEATTEMGLFETMYNCRAMRKLDTKEVPEAHLLKLIGAANQAPSGSNTQGARWIVVRDPETKAQLAALNKIGVESYLAPLVDNPGSLSHQPADKRQSVAGILWSMLTRLQQIHLCHILRLAAHAGIDR